jgi:hypothetical protein
LAFLAGEHELAIIGSPGGHAPSPQIRGMRHEQADRAVLARLRIGFLAERHRPLDEQGLLANVPPPHTERFTGTKTRIREDRDDVASQASSATRIASIVRDERGRTSSRRGDLAFFTRRTGFAEM